MIDTLGLIRKAQSGNKRAYDDVAKANFNLVHKIANKFLNRGYEYEEIVSVGLVGLTKAIQRFDFSYDIKFSTFAVPMIVGEIKLFIRDDYNIKFSREYKVIAQEVYFYKLDADHEVTLEELSNKLGYSIEQIKSAVEATNLVKSLNEITFSGDKDILLQDTIKDEFCLEETAIENVERQKLWECISQLGDRERVVLNYRLRDKSQKYIGNILNLSQVQVSRIEKKAKENLKGILISSGLFENYNIAI